jgi:hypothetical protein
MTQAFTRFVGRLAMEPPFRLAARALLRLLPAGVERRARWELTPRPEYLVGLVAGALQARRQGISEISAIEFGVAGGRGLLALQSEAVAVERDLGVRVRVFGFDMGAPGLPAFIGDHRDHPDLWRPGDFPMDVDALRTRLAPGTTLILGPVAETVQTFVRRHAPPPIGFAAFDLDLYSSTRDALRLLADPATAMLWHTPLYFDDIVPFAGHRFAGELLALDEFNTANERVRIDRWHGVATGRPFPERDFLARLFVAHDLAALGAVQLPRPAVRLPLDASVTVGRSERVEAVA